RRRHLTRAPVGGAVPADATLVGECADLAMALIGTGFAYRADERARQAEVVRQLLPQVRDLRRLGSAALDLCLVADGRLDGYFESGLRPWDLAAGWLVVTESGGVVVGPGGGDPDPQLTVAGNGSLVEALAATVDRTVDRGSTHRHTDAE
ncbi:MAG TPA: inositol monophosphatase family protein, partial [Dermatophilaceae bacterium]|nr:inositol monophosphatase family protein [Dermatophilaceae bacterium]